MYACQCFLPLLILELKSMYWLHFWELLFSASKNVQANMIISLVPCETHSTRARVHPHCTCNLMTTNRSDHQWSPRKSHRRYTRGLPPTNPILILHFPKVWWNQTGLPTKIKLMTLVVIMISLAVISWRATWAPCVARCAADASSASNHSRRELSLQSGKWKPTERLKARERGRAKPEIQISLPN